MVRDSSEIRPPIRTLVKEAGLILSNFAAPPVIPSSLFVFEVGLSGCHYLRHSAFLFLTLIAFCWGTVSVSEKQTVRSKLFFFISIFPASDCVLFWGNLVLLLLCTASLWSWLLCDIWDLWVLVWSAQTRGRRSRISLCCRWALCC